MPLHQMFLLFYFIYSFILNICVALIPKSGVVVLKRTHAALHRGTAGFDSAIGSYRTPNMNLKMSLWGEDWAP